MLRMRDHQHLPQVSEIEICLAVGWYAEMVKLRTPAGLVRRISMQTIYSHIAGAIGACRFLLPCLPYS